MSKITKAQAQGTPKKMTQDEIMDIGIVNLLMAVEKLCEQPPGVEISKLGKVELAHLKFAVTSYLTNLGWHKAKLKRSA